MPLHAPLPAHAVLRAPATRPAGSRWRRPRHLLAITTLLLGAVPAQAERVAPADAPAFVQKLQQLAVKILRGNGPGTQYLGSGFAWVKDGHAYAITNFHVAQKGLGKEPAPGGLYVGYPAPTGWHPAVRMVGLPNADLALIETRVEAPQKNPYTLGMALPGEEVWSISYDEKAYEQAEPLINKGRVVAFSGVLYPQSILVLKAPVPPDAVAAYIIDGSDCVHGASGSMILNGKGELIAVNAGRLENGLCIAVAIEELEKALAR